MYISLQILVVKKKKIIKHFISLNEMMLNDNKYRSSCMSELQVNHFV